MRVQTTDAPPRLRRLMGFANSCGWIGDEMIARRYSAARRRRFRTGLPLAAGVVLAAGMVTAMAAAISVPSSNVDHIGNLPGPPPVTQTTIEDDTDETVASTVPSTSVVDSSVVDSSMVDSSLIESSVVPPSEPGASTPTP